tara:strand:+ start:10451 stop:11299 length:849 start_codon:yes stop_codon:yes gene_type:complete
MEKKYFLVFHTIFLPYENVIWLEEFLIYYINLGFEHFYLYDNTGSIGRNGSSSSKTKYGFKIQKDNEDYAKMFDNLLCKYREYITHVIWQPLDNKGNITYNPFQGITHFKENYSLEAEYCAFMDIDEFLFSELDINIKNYILEKEKVGVTRIILHQKKFKDRHYCNCSLITQNFECFDLPYKTNGWIQGHKSIIKLDEIKHIGKDFHSIYTNGKEIFADPKYLRFNHYNLNKRTINHINKTCKTNFEANIFESEQNMIEPKKNEIYQYVIDDSMKRYKFLFD